MFCNPQQMHWHCVIGFVLYHSIGWYHVNLFFFSLSIFVMDPKVLNYGWAFAHKSLLFNYWKYRKNNNAFYETSFYDPILKQFSYASRLILVVNIQKSNSNFWLVTGMNLCLRNLRWVYSYYVVKSPISIFDVS